VDNADGIIDGAFGRAQGDGTLLSWARRLNLPLREGVITAGL
jgi:hypothetical protein